MTLARRPVQRDHVQSLLRLVVRPDQVGLVSTNAKTLAQAAYEKGSHVWGLWDDETPVGLMAMIHPGEYPWDSYALPEPPGDRTAAYLWRLMIGAEFQGKSYGAAALAEAVAQARAWGCSRMTAHVADSPSSNLGFYERFGFRTTGIVEGDELVISIEI
jgi:diamine N-acetyltransferase